MNTKPILMLQLLSFPISYKRYFFMLLCMVIVLTATAKDNLKYVNPMIGTGAHYSKNAEGLWGKERKQKPIPTSKLGIMAGYDYAHDPGQCIPAVLMPHGMNFWTAQTEDTEQKEIAPYYYDDKEIQGFRNSHFLEGSMTQDYGSFTIMPLSTELIKNPIVRGSVFSHSDEVSTPSYYSVVLPRYGVKVEMTATSRTAIFKLTYKEAGDVYLSVNPNSDEGLGQMAYNVDSKEITGTNPIHRIYQGKGLHAGYDGHFVLTINKPIIEGGTYWCDSVHNAGAYIRYHVEAGETVLVKAASSFTDVNHARENLYKEIPGWDFDAVYKALTDVWQKKLSVIDAESNDKALLTNFYTALYHSSFLPHAINDCDGSYPSFAGGETIKHTDSNYYDDYSLWDTYRALHPLLCLIDPQCEGDMVQSMIDKAEDGGWMPIFPCWNSYTSEMIGDHACSLVADAYTKGIRNFNIDKAYKLLIKNAYEQPGSYDDYCEGKGRRALDSYLKYKFIPVEDSVKEAYHQREQTSRTMEYAYDDYCLAVFAKALGHNAEAKDLMVRSQYYQNVYNPLLGWVDGRHSDGSFVGGNPFDFQKYITEGKSCHYTWYVPHDVTGLVRLMGGKKSFIEKLNTVFNQGHYWHGNEPCHQVAYLYDYVGRPDMTQDVIRRVMAEEYAALHDGLAGNDDAGQMSAWYVFSAMGFYPVCPSKPEYAIGYPFFDRVTIHNSNGKDFMISTSGSRSAKAHIRSTKLNGKTIKSSIIQHDDIIRGGSLVFVLSE